MKIISGNNIYYKISFSILFPEQNIIFIDYKNLNDYNFEENEIIVLGCDDVLNKEYVLYTYEKFVGLNNKIIVIITILIINKKKSKNKGLTHTGRLFARITLSKLARVSLRLSDF